MNKRIFAALLLFALLFSLAACSKGGEGGTARSPEADFPVAFCLGAQPASLDTQDYATGDDATYLGTPGGDRPDAASSLHHPRK